MYVPPYVPQPIEIADNVAQAGYLVRLGFVRRVVFLHFVTGVLVAGMAVLPLPSLPPVQAAGLTFILLVVLSMIRGLARGRMADVRFSAFLLPLLLLTLGLWMRALYDQGWAVWSLGIGLTGVQLYVALCGRDLSYVGMFVLSWLASSAAIVAVAWATRMPWLETATALTLNGSFLFYFVYDLAALLTRRRAGEEAGAVADLYRDVLNGITYPIRVWHHWREHRIWSPSARSSGSK